MGTSTMITFLGMLITSGSCFRSIVESEDQGNSMILSNQNLSATTSSLETLVDEKCKHYTAGLQNQMNELKAKVDRLEVNSKNHQKSKNDDISLVKEMKKRDAPKGSQDASLRKGQLSAPDTNGMPQNILATKATGIPTSCNDLQKLGHSSNGLYLIKKILPKNEGAKIQTVYCDFQSHSSNESYNVIEEFIGNLEVKTKTVHFYVQRNSDFGGRAVIPFDLARLNEGNAFNLKSGIFMAPVKGIYHFQLSAVKTGAVTILSIALQVNGVKIGVAFTQKSARDSLDAVFLSASLRLNASDKVNLFKTDGQLVDYGGNPSRFADHFTHFSGWLVEEDFM